MKVLMVMPSRVQRIDLAQRLLERARRRRIAEADVAVVEVGRRLAIGDDDDLPIGALLPAQDLPRELEAVLHVGAVVVLIPIDRGQIAGLISCARYEKPMMLRWSRGYLPRISESSASATRLAALKQPL